MSGRRRSGGRAFALAALGGVLCFLGFVGFGLWPLALICLVPLWEALETRSTSLRRAAALGLVFGWVAYAGGYHWMWRIVDVFLGGDVFLGAALWLADSSWFALRFALYALLYAVVRRRGWQPAMAALPPLLVVEWLYPLLFPVHLGHALVELPRLVQISDLGGPLLPSTLVVLANLAVFAVWRHSRGRETRAGAGLAIMAAALLACLSAAYGARSIRAVAAASAASPSLSVGIVQANLGVLEKGDAERAHRSYLEQTRELLAGGAPDLVVWPETVYMRGLRGPLPISGTLVRQDLDVPLLFGGVLVRTDSGRRLSYNSALLIGADGVVRDAYDKNLLIPFTEYVPFGESIPALGERFHSLSHFAAAVGVPALRFGAARIATPICYESVRPSFVRRMVGEGNANLIATLANDAWFGDSQEPWIHLTMARLRAIENRRYVVRATNSGVSAIIDATGRIVGRSGLLTRENLRGEVRLLEATTLYTRWGDWPGWIALAVVVLALLVSRRAAA